MSDILRYQTVDELQNLSLAELTALWELVPTDRQRRYKAVYDREVRQAGATGSDTLEQQVADELVNRYATTALVPIGARWARTPARIQQAAKTDVDLIAPETLEEQRTPKKPPIAIFAAAGVAFVIMALLVLPRLSGRGQKVVSLSITPTHTATPGRSPTSTPIALEDQDAIVRGGDAGRAAAYPVNLRVLLPDAQQPRVFVVQRRVIDTAEWNFDPNPDTASYLANLSVRPVIGVPYSAENALLFQNMNLGTLFTLQMNTGATLRFVFDSRLEISRSDTGIFRQVGPGLVLVLIGERDKDDAPTAMRQMITAKYAPEQELSRNDAMMVLLPTVEPTSPPTAASTLSPLAGLDVTLISVETTPGQIIVKVRILNGQGLSVQIGQDTIWLALGFAPEPQGPRLTAQGLAPFKLLPGQAVDLTLHWVWQGEPFASLNVEQYQLSIKF